MSAWRRKAIEAFPELRRELNSKPYSVYRLFFDLLPMARQAHADGDQDSLRRVYGFAEWCLQQRSEEPGNAAGVAFYEHLFDSTGREYWGEIAQLLSPVVVNLVWPLWEFRMSRDQFQQLQAILVAHGRPIHRPP
jgi:hypothetical protein